MTTSGLSAYPPGSPDPRTPSWFDLVVLLQDAGLLQLLAQGVAVEGVAIKSSAIHDQTTRKVLTMPAITLTRWVS